MFRALRESILPSGDLPARARRIGAGVIPWCIRVEPHSTRDSKHFPRGSAIPMVTEKSCYGAAAAAVLLSVVFAPVPSARAQAAVTKDTTEATILNKVTVTATRNPKTVFRTASPVVVVDSSRIRSTLPNGVAELLRESPVVDITGSGRNQGRPIIRGQRGQRICFLKMESVSTTAADSRILERFPHW